MKIHKARTQKTLITLVTCQHGNEIFGCAVYDYFLTHADEFPSIQLILANEEAVLRGVRYIDENLNRAFPGSPEGNHEQKIAAQIKSLITESVYVIDIHTTTADIKMTPIIIQRNEQVDAILNLCSSKEIVVMPFENGAHSLIGNAHAGISLEYNEQFAETDDALKQLYEMIKKLQQGLRNPTKLRKIFMIDDVISKVIAVPRDTKNFTYSETLGVYPFLLFEAYYQDIHAHAAHQFIEEVI